MNLPRLIVLIATVFAVCLLSVGDVEAQLPPHNPVLNWEADFWNLEDGHHFTHDQPEKWLDTVSGTEARIIGNQWTYETNELNGHAVMRNNTGDEQIWVSDAEMQAHAPNLLVGSNDYTIVSVIRPASPPAEPTNIGVAATWGTASANHQNQWYMSTNEVDGGFQRMHNAVFLGSATPLSNFGLTNADVFADFHAFGWVKSGGANPVVVAHTNGLTSPLSGNFSNDLGTHDQGGHGRRLNFGYGGNRFKGDLAEIMFWDYALSESQLSDVDAYIAQKYGVVGIPEPSTLLLAVVVIGAFGGAIRNRHRYGIA